MIATKKISNAYLEQEIMTLNPVQLLIKAYDAGLLLVIGETNLKPAQF